MIGDKSVELVLQICLDCTWEDHCWEPDDTKFKEAIRKWKEYDIPSIEECDGARTRIVKRTTEVIHE